MNTEGNFHGQIEAYLTNRLAPAERAAFEEALATDPALARETELRRLEFDLSETLLADSIRSQFETLRAEPPPSGKKRRLLWLLAAAALLATISILLWVWPGSEPAGDVPPVEKKATPPSSIPDAVAPQAIQTPPPDLAPAKPTQPINRHLALANELYQPPEFETLRSPEPSSSDPIDVAGAAWKKQDYNSVIAVLQPITATHPAYWRAMTLRAHAHFQLKHFSQASRDFTVIAAGKVMPWSEEAEGYQLLALLADGQGDTPAFRQYLQKILADAGHPAFDLAQTIQVRWPG